MTASETVAVVLTDVEGSTRLWRDAPKAMNAAMARHHELVAEAVAAHGGWRPVDQGEGDATFWAFDSATAAVAAALELQRALAKEVWPTPAPLAVRIGVHVGEVITRDGNLFGDTVNRCARIRGIGHGGQTLLSTAAYELARDGLPDGASLRSLGEHRMKDLIRPEVVWQLDHPDLATEFPPPTSLNVGRHNLPMQLTSFLGRDGEVRELVKLLAEGSRLVTITGFGGMGKTRLALAVAAELVDGTGDGACFVDLSGLDDAHAVPREIGAVVGARDTGAGMRPAVLDHLRNKRVLLVLDNLEQILDCAPFVSELLGAAPGVQVLATSREPLALRGEIDFRLEPFEVPVFIDSPRTAEELSANVAVTLFVDRARDARRGFSLDADNAPTIAAICARLDGQPLAIELAAARIAALTPTTLLSRLDQSLGFLAGRERDRPDRHRTVRAVVEWSYDLLGPDEKAMLARLSIFPGSVGLEAIEAICAQRQGQPPLDALSVLDELVAKSLVRCTEEAEEPRFAMLVSVRDFAASKLDPEDRRFVKDLHLEYFLARSVAGAATADGPDEQPWHDEQLRDAHNFRTALTHAEAITRNTEQLLLAANLFELWYLFWHREEGRDWLRRARLAVNQHEVDPALLAVGRCMEAWLSPVVSDVESNMISKAIELAARSGDPAVRAFAYQSAARLATSRPQLEQALDRGLELAEAARAEAVPIRWGMTRPDAVEHSLGLMFAHSVERWSDPETAIRRCEALLRRADELGHPGNVGDALWVLGWLAADVGDVDSAVRWLDRCLEDTNRREDKRATARAALARACARVRAGLDNVEQLNSLIEAYVDAPGIFLVGAVVLSGDLRASAGDLEPARAAYQRALGLSPTAYEVDPRWRLLRLDRLSGLETGRELEEYYSTRGDARWALPDQLGCLVEAAVIAEGHGLSVRAALLTATVRGMRGPFLLPELILADLADLETRYTEEPTRCELPATLFGDVAVS